MYEASFGIFDLNGDDAVELSEFACATAFESNGETYAGMVNLFYNTDVDRNGTLSEAEVAALYQVEPHQPRARFQSASRPPAKPVTCHGPPFVLGVLAPAHQPDRRHCTACRATCAPAVCRAVTTSYTRA